MLILLGNIVTAFCLVQVYGEREKSVHNWTNRADFPSSPRLFIGLSILVFALWMCDAQMLAAGEHSCGPKCQKCWEPLDPFGLFGG